MRKKKMKGKLGGRRRKKRNRVKRRNVVDSDIFCLV